MVQARGDAAAFSDPMSALTFASPRTLRIVGVALVLLSIALGLLEVCVIGSVHIKLIALMFFSGAVSLWRAG
jgi:hypothetical protein